MFKVLEDEINSVINKSLNEDQYFKFHKNRYKRFDQFLDKTFFLKSNKPKVLEIGSHYLHSSVLLSSKNFQVDAMDVSEFWKLNFVKLRAKKYNLNPIIENNLSKLKSMSGIHNKYDLVVFAEIIEHITFNPINFWKTIYQILKPGGIIYISTPNSFSLPYLIRNFKNMFLLKSTGISIDEIMSNVTYGHHWKEYSASEIKKYFRFLSSDFEVTVYPYQYRSYDLKSPNLIFKILSILGNMTNTFADDLEVIVNLKDKKNWILNEPKY